MMVPQEKPSSVRNPRCLAVQLWLIISKPFLPKAIEDIKKSLRRSIMFCKSMFNNDQVK